MKGESGLKCGGGDRDRAADVGFWPFLQRVQRTPVTWKEPAAAEGLQVPLGLPERVSPTTGLLPHLYL